MVICGNANICIVQVKGVMGVACCERYTFDERIDHANRLLMNPSLILIWSFTDPIHPQVRCAIQCVNICCLLFYCLVDQLVVVTRLLPVDAEMLHHRTSSGLEKPVKKWPFDIAQRVGTGHPITTQVATAHEYPLVGFARSASPF